MKEKPLYGKYGACERMCRYRELRFCLSGAVFRCLKTGERLKVAYPRGPTLKTAKCVKEEVK